MKSLPLGLAALASGLLASPAVALQGGPATVSADDVPSSREIVCRRLPPPAGSRFLGRRVCKTEAEWAAMETERDLFFDQMSDRSRTQDSCRNSPSALVSC